MKTWHLFSDNHATMSMTSKLRVGDEAHRALVCHVATDFRAAVFVTRPPWCSRSLCAKQLAARKCALPMVAARRRAHNHSMASERRDTGAYRYLRPSKEQELRAMPSFSRRKFESVGVISVPFDKNGAF
jgi:hypothetical protein